MKSQSFNRSQTPVWKLQFLNFCHKYRTHLHLSLGGTIAYVLNLSTPAQACTGFMCGAKDGLLADGVISSSEFMTTGVNFMFIAANTILSFVFLFGLVFIIVKLIERENFITPGVIFIVILFGILIVNWASGYLFGVTDAGTSGKAPAGAGSIEGVGVPSGAGQFQ